MKSGGGALRKPVSGGGAVVSKGVGPDESDDGMKLGGAEPGLRKPVSGGGALVVSGCGLDVACVDVAWSTEMNSGGADDELDVGAGVGVGAGACVSSGAMNEGGGAGASASESIWSVAPLLN